MKDAIALIDARLAALAGVEDEISGLKAARKVLAQVRSQAIMESVPPIPQEAAAPRQTGVTNAVEKALAGGLADQTLAQIAALIEAKPGSVRAALHILRKKGLAVEKSGLWSSAQELQTAAE